MHLRRKELVDIVVKAEKWPIRTSDSSWDMLGSSESLFAVEIKKKKIGVVKGESFLVNEQKIKKKIRSCCDTFG